MVNCARRSNLRHENYVSMINLLKHMIGGEEVAHSFIQILFDNITIGLVKKPVKPSGPRDLEEKICLMVEMISSSEGILHSIKLSSSLILLGNILERSSGQSG